MHKVVSVLFGGLFTLGTAYALGCLALRRLRTNFTREEHPLFALLAGAPLLSLAVFLLATAHLIYDPVLLATGLLSFFFLWKTGAWRLPEDRLPALPRLWRWLFWPLFLVFATVGLINAMGPEISPDGTTYHLGIVGHYYRAHGFRLIASNMYSFLSQGLEMLFLCAWAFGRHSAAALVHYGFLVTLTLLVLRYGQRQGLPAVGAAAGLFVLLSPVILVDGSSSYNDVAVACTLFGLFYLLEIDAPPLLTGLLAGFGYALKYTAFLGAVYLGLRYLVQRRWRHLAVACVPAALMIVPWVLKTWILGGNPFLPLLNSWWPNQFVHPSFEADYQELMRWYSGLQTVGQIPRELTIKGGVLAGFFGPLFYLTPLALLGLRRPAGRRALLCAVLYSLPYAANVGTRFLIPAAPFWAFALAAGLPAVTLPVLLAAHAFLSFPDQPARYCAPWAWRIEKIHYRPALGLETPEHWMAVHWPPYRVARMVEGATPPGAVVFAFSPIPESYTAREIWASYQSGPNEVLRDNILAALVPDFQPQARLEFHFPAAAYSAFRIVQTAAPEPGKGDHDQWSISELHIRHQGRELSRDDDWRLTARPNPWGIQAAFDNNPLTRWRTWARIKPGMYVEVTFGHPRTADDIQLDISNDQWGTRLRLEGRDAAGAWHDLGHDPVRTGLAPPLGLRRLATEQLKRAGVGYLLVSEDDFSWQDFRDNAALWGLHEAAHVDNMRLYKLE